MAYWENNEKQELYYQIKIKKQKNDGIITSISGMLDKLNVSKSGYYDYVNRKPSKQKVRKQELSKKIKVFYEESHEIYGDHQITETEN